MAVRDEGTVPCNNDLLAANFIDDGQKLWLIDYEYSGNGDPGFELGNVWSESNLSLEQLEELVTHYHGGARPDQVARARLLGGGPVRVSGGFAASARMSAAGRSVGA